MYTLEIEQCDWSEHSTTLGTAIVNVSLFNIKLLWLCKTLPAKFNINTNLKENKICFMMALSIVPRPKRAWGTRLDGPPRWVHQHHFLWSNETIIFFYIIDLASMTRPFKLHTQPNTRLDHNPHTALELTQLEEWILRPWPWIKWRSSPFSTTRNSPEMVGWTIKK